MDKTIYQVIADIQDAMPKMKKDQPGYNYKFFDINQILEVLKPVLKAQNATLTQPLQVIEGRTAVLTIIACNGLHIQSSILLPNLDDPQKMGSAITYYRRYSLVSLLNLESEDDDGKLAAEPKKTLSKTF